MKFQTTVGSLFKVYQCMACKTYLPGRNLFSCHGCTWTSACSLTVIILFSCFVSVKHKLVRNTRTQTSPQESISSEESLLQTPLPRKRPPVPAVPSSHYNLQRSRYKGTRFDVNSGGEKKARVRFEPDASPVLPSYKAEMTDKGN